MLWLMLASSSDEESAPEGRQYDDWPKNGTVPLSWNASDACVGLEKSGQVVCAPGKPEVPRRIGKVAGLHTHFCEVLNLVLLCW